MLLTALFIIGSLVLGGCAARDTRRPDNTTPAPNQTRTVPAPTRVTPPVTPTPNQTRTAPNPNDVSPNTAPSETRTPGTTNTPGTTGTPGTTNTPGTTGTPRTGTTPRTSDNTTTPGTPRTVRRSTTTGDTGNRSKEIARDIAKEKDIESASCVITGDTALVGLQFDKQYKGDVTDAVKKSVEKRVKEHEPSIKRVAVTADPDVLSRIKTMATDIEKGKPLSGFTTEIEEILRRINPF